MSNQKLWSPLNSEPWCTIFCRLFDMAPHIGTFLVLIKVSEKAKKMCLPWPRRWSGPCYRMPRYFVHEAIRLFLVLFFYYQVWFQLWYAVSLVLIMGYGFKEHRVKRNIIPAAMVLIGVSAYTVCWCGFFGRKQDGSHAAAQRQKPTDKARNQDDTNNNGRSYGTNNNINNNINDEDSDSGYMGNQTQPGGDQGDQNTPPKSIFARGEGGGGNAGRGRTMAEILRGDEDDESLDGDYFGGPPIGQVTSMPDMKLHFSEPATPAATPFAIPAVATSAVVPASPAATALFAFPPRGATDDFSDNE